MCCVDRFDGLINASKTRQRLKTISQSDAHGSLALSQFEQAEQQYCGIRPNKSLLAGGTSTRMEGLQNYNFVVRFFVVRRQEIWPQILLEILEKYNAWYKSNSPKFAAKCSST